MDPAPKHASPTSESTAHPPANPNLTAMPHLNPTPATKMPTPMPMTPIMTMTTVSIENVCDCCDDDDDDVGDDDDDDDDDKELVQ